MSPFRALARFKRSFTGDATVALAVNLANRWWGNPKKKGWQPPPLQIPTLDNFKARSRSRASKEAYIEQERFSKRKMQAMWADVLRHPEFYRNSFGITDERSLEEYWSKRKTTEDLEALWRNWTSDDALAKRWATLSGQEPEAPKINKSSSELLQEIRDMSDDLRMVVKFKKLSRQRLQELIRYIDAYEEASGPLSEELSQVRKVATQRQQNFQRVARIKDIVDESRIPYGEAHEAYLTQLYVDAARAQLRLKNLTEAHFPKNDSKYEVKVAGADSIKGTARARTKAKENAEGNKSNFSSLTDIARGSIYFNSLQDIVGGMKKFIENLPPQCIIPKFKNRFAGGNHYRDILITITLDNNHLTEMQFHSKAIADIKSDGITLSSLDVQRRLQEAVTEIRQLPAAPPLDTQAILTKIEAGTDWLISGHDLYNITRWIGELKGTNDIKGKISSVSNQMYDDAYERATRSLNAAQIKELEGLTMETVQSWRRVSDRG